MKTRWIKEFDFEDTISCYGRCPDCFHNSWFYMLSKTHHRILCPSCGWRGDSHFGLLSEEEYINIKRTELIDKIL